MLRIELALSTGTLLLAAGGLSGCATEVLNPIDQLGEGGGGGDANPTTAGGNTGAGGGEPETYTRQSISGDITWTVTFDADAKAAGATDCTYTRHYEGVEDGSAAWLCADCDKTYRTTVEVVDGLEDCYAQVTSADPATTEWLGLAAGAFRRGFGATMSEQGTATVDGAVIDIANDVADVEAPAGGTLAFEVRGQLATEEGEGDPLHGFRAPDSYACGWEKSDPAPYTGDYALTLGGVVPDGLFKDACEDTVRLHDLAGSYLVIDMAAMDCPPCRQMAALEEAFVADMAAQGIAVHVVTLLAPSLDDTLGETTTEMLTTWRDSYALTSPVLADRGWGLSVFAPAIGDGTGYPSWVIVDPELRVIDFDTGFQSFAPFKSAIAADAAKR